MRRPFLVAAALAIVLCSSLASAQTPAAASYAVRCGRLLTGDGTTELRDAWLVVRDGKIASVGTTPPPADLPVVVAVASPGTDLTRLRRLVVDLAESSDRRPGPTHDRSPRLVGSCSDRAEATLLAEPVADVADEVPDMTPDPDRGGADALLTRPEATLPRANP